MPKFFIEKGSIQHNNVCLSPQDSAHVAKVLRKAPGDCLLLCDGEGTDYEAKITSCNPKEVELRILKSMPCFSEPNVQVTLFQGLPKQGKMDYIIEKCTELGVFQIVPVACHRCVAEVKGNEKQEKKLARWNKIAQEAVKQCGRGAVPKVLGVASFQEAVKTAKSLDFSVAAYENERELSLKETIETKKKPKSVGIFIGPEGGFEASEIALLQEANIPAVTLGKRILRTETAGCAVLTCVMYAFGELS